MSNSNLNILLVDDDPVLVEMHKAFLEKDGFSVLVAEDGERALAILDLYHENIGVVVSDISMPKIDGYELCERIKSNETTKNLPVIFVSAHTNLNEKMKGYDVGADDYITKPVDEEELSKKIGVLLEIKEKQKALSEQATESQNMAMQAMTYSSELGQVINLYQNVLDAKDYSEVANNIFSAISGFNLISILQIYTPQQVLNISVSGIVSPLEVNVIELARDKGRFFDFGARTIMNYRTFSILIKNMPLGDDDKYGRIKDILGMLGNGLEAKIVQLNNEYVLQKKDSVIMSVSESIRNIEELFGTLQKENILAIEDMNEQVRDAVVVLGLTEDQENNIQEITDNCLDRSNKAFFKGVKISENLKNISKQIEYITGTKI